MSLTRLLFGFVVSCQVCVVAGNYGIRAWNLEEGLPSSQVVAIDQAADGRLWVATSRGLAAFDGHEFEVFNHVSHPELGTSDLSDLLISPSGEVWFSERSGQVGFMDEAGFQSIQGVPLEGDDYVDRMVVSDDGRIVGATRDALVLQLAPGNPRIIRKRRAWLEPRRESSPGVQLHFDHDGQLFVGLHTELNRWTSAGMPRVLPELWVDTSEDRAWLWALGGSPRGGVWVAADLKVRRYDNGAWVENYGDFPWGDDSRITALLETRDGVLWIGSRGEGLRGLTGADDLIVISKGDGLPSVDINTLFEDRESNLWLGTDGGGLVRIRENSFEQFGAESILGDVRVNSMVEDATHDLWIATDGQGLLHWNGYEFRSVFGLDRQVVNVLLHDSRDRVWAGTQNDGLAVLYPSDSEQREEKLENYIGQSIVSLFEDSQRNVWVGAESGVAVFREGDIGDEPVSSFPTLESIRCILEDKEGALWFGTLGRGVYRWRNGSMTQFTTRDGLPDNAVTSMCLDEQGGLCIGTYGGGIARFSEDAFVPFLGNLAGLDGFISGLVNDQRGSLWLGTSRGINRIAWTDLNLVSTSGVGSRQSFGKEDGLAFLECSDRFHPSILLSDLGRLYFPMKRGVAEIVLPELESLPSWIPPVSIRDVLADETPLLRSEVDGLPVVNIGPGTRRVEVTFSGIGLSAPEQVRYRYRIRGNGADWISLGPVRSVSFLELEAGDYQFEVTSALQSGRWNTEPATLLIRVAPNWWETTVAFWLAGAAGVLVIVASIGGLARRRIRLEQAKRNMDQLLYRERERIAQDMHDDLGARLTQLSFQGELAKRALGETKTLESRLDTVVNSVRQTAQALDDVVWMTNPRNDNLERLVSHLVQIACDMSDSVGWKLELVIPNAVGLDTVAGKNRHEIVMVVKELLNNASKHSACSCVRFEIEVSEDELRVRVIDDGRGFDVAACQAKGNGLGQMQQRAQSAGGSLAVSSEAGQGTVAELVFRLDGIGG